jgi:hypothetical protein
VEAGGAVQGEGAEFVAGGEADGESGRGPAFAAAGQGVADVGDDGGKQAGAAKSLRGSATEA